MATKFRTMFNNKQSIPVIPAGQKYRYETIVYEPFQQDAAGKFLNFSKYPKKAKGRKIDCQGEMNSYLDSTRLSTILKSLSQNQMNVSFDESMDIVDLTELPKTLGEAKAASALAVSLKGQVDELLKKYDAEAKAAEEAQKAASAVSLSSDDILALKQILNERSGK